MTTLLMKTKYIKNYLLMNNYVFFEIILLISSFLLLYLSKDDGIFDFLRFILVSIFISFVFRTLVFKIYSNLNLIDGGFTFSLSLGLAFLFYINWIFSSLNLFLFNTVNCIFFSFIIIIFCIVLFYKKDKKSFLNKEENSKFIFACIVFLFIISIVFYIKGFNASTYTTEKMMDFGFMQSIYRQQAAIPNDFWFSGTNLNYYYLGQSFSTFVMMISFSTPEYGYNIMLCLIFTIAIMLCFNIVYSLLFSMKINKKNSFIGGLIGATNVMLAGNGHWILYGVFYPFIEKITNRIYQKEYWFPDSTRFIGYNPDIADKTIHEFPSYSFILGDLHAHVCNILFTLPLIALLVDYSINDKDKNKKVCSCHVLLISFLIGLYQGVNYWDFPIYFTISGAIILFIDIKNYNLNIKTIFLVFKKGLFVFIISKLLLIPFHLNFEEMVTAVKFTKNHTSVYQLIVLWGIPIFISMWFLLKEFSETRKTKTTLTNIQIVIITFILCAIGLVIVPEIVYVEDIYGLTYARSNTMFKLTYQAFILFGLILGIIFGICLDKIKKTKQKSNNFFVLFLLIISILLSMYSVWSSKEWFGNVFAVKERTGISATNFLTDNLDFYKEYGAIQFLLNEDDKNINIIEGAGTSYSYDCKLSTFAGVNTIIGWHTHEWLWKNNLKEVKEREQEVEFFYENGDIRYCAFILDKYNIKYIYVGSSERNKYNINENGFLALGFPVWESLNEEYYLIEVNKGIVIDNLNID